MISRKLFWIILIACVVLFVVHRSHNQAPKAVQQKHDTSVDPKERTPYHRPDRGFGTIDGSKDVRDVTNDESARAKKTQDQIDQQ